MARVGSSHVMWPPSERKSGGDVAGGCDFVFQMLLQTTTVSKLKSNFLIHIPFQGKGSWQWLRR